MRRLWEWVKWQLGIGWRPVLQHVQHGERPNELIVTTEYVQVKTGRRRVYVSRVFDGLY